MTRERWRYGAAYPIHAGLIAWERGELTGDGEAELFQALADVGTLARMGARYVDRARVLVAVGAIRLPVGQVNEIRKADRRTAGQLDVAEVNEMLTEMRRAGQ